MKPTMMKKDAELRKMMTENDKGIMVHRHSRGKERSSEASMNKGAPAFHTEKGEKLAFKAK